MTGGRPLPAALAVFERRPAPHWIPVLLPIGLVLLFVGQLLVANSFALARHPVSSFAAQFTFDGATVRDHYLTMQAQGTLDAFITSRRLDYVFILGLALTTTLAPIIYARLQPPGSRLRALDLICVWIMPLSPLLDAIENVLEFAMLNTVLSDPNAVPHTLTVTQSWLSVAKYATGPPIGLGLLTVNVIALTLTAIRTGGPGAPATPADTPPPGEPVRR
ncbi:hypothetical protein CLV72_10282 [Allonocardiopsis opalescens]|uniref:Uncharacterized protein n=2 Tax=Allonocardiopsis opalescens TaxID=1144618 RepID=A0A2T0Q9G7_9ACTN|nr:hypothetical protein CLV72_10282 [Allonocardiopsis opalescens]